MGAKPAATTLPHAAADTSPPGAISIAQSLRAHSNAHSAPLRTSENLLPLPNSASSLDAHRLYVVHCHGDGTYVQEKPWASGPEVSVSP